MSDNEFWGSTQLIAIVAVFLAYIVSITIATFGWWSLVVLPALAILYKIFGDKCDEFETLYNNDNQ